MSCRSGCTTKDCESYADCLKAANLRVAYCRSAAGSDATKQKKWDRELADYRSAVTQGIQPSGTDRAAIDRAVRISNETGQPYQG